MQTKTIETHGVVPGTVAQSAPPTPAPTAVSEAVNARLAAYDAWVAAQPRGSLGAIEPELLGTTPRRIRDTAVGRQILSATAATLAGFATLCAFAPTLGVSAKFLGYIVLHFLGQIVAQFFLHKNGSVLTNRFLLANGVATRALVTAQDIRANHPNNPAKHILIFRYKYEMADGTVSTNTLTFTQQRAWHLGFVEGATFTVLYNPKKPTAHTPYFQITEAEIVGAMGAKITPP